MQVRPTHSKPKYKISDFVMPGNHATNKIVYTSEPNNLEPYCICKQYSKVSTRKCNRCLAAYHNCVTKIPSKSTDWECFHCLSVHMDPIFTSDSILIQTFFKTDSVYQYTNLIEFHFQLNSAQLLNPVEIRCLQDSRGAVLAWPMQGEFYLNIAQHPDPIIDFKPLLFNSNRKHRKEQALLLPTNKLKLGRNVLTFSIPRLNNQTFGQKYQCEERAVYFIGIYAIKKLTKEQLISKTIKTSRIDKESSLKLLVKLIDNGDPELSVQKIKLCLECPYTKSRIKIPVRGKNCTHYMCLCLDTLIQTRMGMNSREWSCPICSNKINEPIIDNFILSMLNDGSAGIEVFLSVTGQYNWITFADQQIQLDSDSEDDLPVKKIEPKQIKSIKKPQINNETKKIVVQTIQLDDTPPSSPRKLPELQIVIPQDLIQNPPSRARKGFEHEQKDRKVSKYKQKNKQREREKKMRNTNNSNYNVQTPEPNNRDFIITDIKQLDFRPITHGEFIKKYFMIQQPRGKIHDDLRTIFREVL